MPAPVICIGSVMVDELFSCSDKAVPATSNPATLSRSAGGVARNIAHHLAMLGVPVQLMAAVGSDPDGNWLYDDCRANGIGVDAIARVDNTTGKYASVLDSDGSLVIAACADECGKYVDPGYLTMHTDLLAGAKLVIADANISEAAISWLCQFCRERSISLLIEPVSVAKGRKMSGINLSGVFMITPNEDELPSFCVDAHENPEACIDELLRRGVANIWLRRGNKGSVIYHKDGSMSLPAAVIQIADSTGAGDAALAGWVAAYYHGLTPGKCLQAGHALALEVLQVHGAVIPRLTFEQLTCFIKKYYPDEQ